MTSFGIPDLAPALEADLSVRMAQVEELLRKQIEGNTLLLLRLHVILSKQGARGFALY